jgi:thiol-disulfide isomerase/thioredoxin
MRRLLPIMLVALALVGACGQGRSEPDDSTGPVVPGTVARLTASLRALRGKPVVVNYWATWCDPCKKETPRLVDAARRFRGRVRFLGVNVEDDLAAARSFARRYHIPYRSLALSKADVQQAQDILGLPVTQFYRADGELAFVNQGEITEDDLVGKIEELVRLGRPVERP